MHFEILVEGQSELTALSILMEKIVGAYRRPHTWTIHKHRGLGRIPVDPEKPPKPGEQGLLSHLPSRLRGYGDVNRDDLVVVVLADLDDESDCLAFKNRLTALLQYCPRRPRVLFRIAVEELESWYLGDRAAVLSAYPLLKTVKLAGYIQDSQCKTWEVLAEAIGPHGLAGILKKGKRSPSVGAYKVQWAKDICPKMDVERNESPSFRCFRDGLRKIAGMIS